jgi:xylan 1,4-beta-xylosidase
MTFGDTYMHLFNASFHALKAVSPQLWVGGPATMELRSVQEFLAAQSKWGVDADFVSTHTVSHHFVQHLSVSLLRV